MREIIGFKIEMLSVLVVQRLLQLLKDNSLLLYKKFEDERSTQTFSAITEFQYSNYLSYHRISVLKLSKQSQDFSSQTFLAIAGFQNSNFLSNRRISVLKLSKQPQNVSTQTFLEHI